MALTEYKEPLETVTFTGGSFLVRGLPLRSIMPLVRDYGAEIAALVAKGKEIYEEKDSRGLASLGALALTSAPDLVTDIIAEALADADSEQAPKADMRKIIDSLPGPVQVDALCKIYALTMVVEGGMGNLLATINTAMTSLNSEIVALALPEMN